VAVGGGIKRSLNIVNYFSTTDDTKGKGKGKERARESKRHSNEKEERLPCAAYRIP